MQHALPFIQFYTISNQFHVNKNLPAYLVTISFHS